MSALIPALGRALVRDGNDVVSLRITGDIVTSPNGSILFGIEWVAARRILNTATQEEWRFFDDVVDGNLVATITINYTDATLETIDTVVRT